MKNLYKYKSGSKYDLQALKDDALWVSTYEKLNDPNDFPLYADKEKVTEPQMDDFLQNFEKSHCCMSLSTSPYLKRLWDYYTDGMKGIVLAYNKDDIDAALKENNIQYKEGRVTYDGKSFDVTDNILQTKTELPEDAFFHKTEDWKEEKEHRYVFEYNQPNSGFLLKPLVPHHIFIGYKMSKTNKELVMNYCRMKNIYLYELKPDRTSNNLFKYKKRVLVRKKEDQPEQEEYEAILH